MWEALRREIWARETESSLGLGWRESAGANWRLSQVILRLSRDSDPGQGGRDTWHVTRDRLQ